MRYLAATLLSFSLLIGGFYAPPAQAAPRCLQNGGDILGCIPITGLIWKQESTYHETFESAVQRAAATTHNIEYYGSGPQWGPVTYTDYFTCSKPSEKIDTSYTDINQKNFNSVQGIFSVDVHVHGFLPHAVCQNAQSYYSKKGGTVAAVAKCPIGYFASREHPGVYTYPYGYMCLPNESMKISNSESYAKSPDCQDSPVEGCASTPNPANIVNGNKNERIEDLRVAGPWPLSWARTSAQESSDVSWHWNSQKSLSISPLFTGGTYAGQYIVSIKRRNGTYISYKAPQVSSGPRTWTVVKRAHYYKNTLEDVWSDGALSHWVLRRRDGVKEIYSAQGEFLRETSSNGHNHHYQQNTSGQLTHIRDDFSHFISASYATGPHNGFDATEPYSYPNSGTQGEYRYSLSLGSIIGVTNINAITDGRRQVNYTWTPTAPENSNNFRNLLTSVEHPDGTQTQYVYGETDDSTSIAAYHLTGVINEENERYLTYKRQRNGAYRIISEWKGAGLDGVGALERLDLSTYGKIVDQDGREFSYTPAGSATNKPTGYATPCPECGGIQGKNLYYASTNDMRASELIEVRDWKNQKTTFNYDASGRMTARNEAVGTPLQRSTTWTYPTDTFIREPLTMTESVKDAAGISRTRTTTYTYSDLPASYPASSPCSGAHGGTSVPCDATRRLLTGISVSVNDGSAARSLTITYTNYGLLDTLTDPMGRITKWTWTADGQVASITRGYGTSIAKTTTYGGHNTEGPTWQRDENGLYTRWTRDLRGRITQEDVGTPGASGIGSTDENGAWPTSLGGVWRTTQMTYRPTGLLMEAILPDGRKFAFDYDVAHRLTGIEALSASGQTLSTRLLELSPAGALLSDTTLGKSGQVELTQSYTYTATRQLASVIDANNNATLVGYDANFMVNSHTTPLGHTNANQFDALNRPTTFTDALNGLASISYGPSDETRSATDAKGVTTHYAYNGYGDLVGIQSPDRGNWAMTVNQNGETVEALDPRGVQIGYTYDALGRVMSRVFDDSAMSSSAPGFTAGIQTHSFAYDACAGGQGRLCGFTDPSGSTQYTYNAWGDVLSKTWTGAAQTFADGITLNTVHTYDEAGRNLTTQYPSGKLLTRTFGADGEIENLSYHGQLILSGADWTSYGAVKGWQWGLTGLSSGQQHVAYTYDQNGHIQSIDDLDTRAYALDPDKRIIGIDDALNVDKSQVYGYDALDRLISVDIGAWAGPLSYTYDGVGNRTGKSDASSATGVSYTYGSGGAHNRLLSTTSIVGGVAGATHSPTYDAMGSMMTDGKGLSLSYDASGRLAEISRGTAGAQYLYNAAGKRMGKRASGTGTLDQTVFAYDESGQLIGAYTPDSAGINGIAVQEELVWLDPWRPVATVRPDGALGIQSPQIHPIFTDHLGTPRKIINQDGFTVWTWDAKEPFGMQLPNQDPSGLGTFEFNSRFPGQWFDDESGLSYNGFRDYHPALGRYVQSDPIGLEAGWNTYNYSSNNSLSKVDYNGLSEHDYTVKIPTLMNEAINKMITEGKRSPGRGWWSAMVNNMEAMSGASWEVCSGQSDYVKKYLEENREQFDDKWEFHRINNNAHHWVFAVSSNPQDPVLRIDPWLWELAPSKKGYPSKLIPVFVDGRFTYIRDNLNHSQVQMIRESWQEYNRGR